MASSVRLASAFLLLGASSISSMCSRMRACSVMRSLKRKIIQQRSISEVHNSYQSATLTTINNFHGTRVAVNRAVTVTILAKSSLSITLIISTRAQSFFHRRQTKIKRTTITIVLKDKRVEQLLGFEDRSQHHELRLDLNWFLS